MSARPVALVVEDSEDQAVILTRLLEREGYDVHVAPDAETTIGRLDAVKPALAIIDLRLPGITGEECLRTIRERHPDCVLIVSSVLDAADYPAAHGALPKPVTGAALRALLERITR